MQDEQDRTTVLLLSQSKAGAFDLVIALLDQLKYHKGATTKNQFDF
jgi:hypothetical protein